MKAFLILEDGSSFCGDSIGTTQDAICEIVFNTSMTGYLEILTDPSYAGQAVVMTYPLIGNYGVCLEDMESMQPWAEGLIVGELSRLSSNFRSQSSIQSFLETNLIPGISGIDTRALTKILRKKGVMKGLITTKEDLTVENALIRMKEHTAEKVIDRVTSKERQIIAGDGFHVAVLDFGAKANIIKSLTQRGCQVEIYPAYSRAKEILAAKPDGILLSNGPGDPKDCASIIEEVRKLYESDVPILAICLGHQLMALATGADTRKMRYGHRGANHPVKDMATGKVYLSSQNHGYVVKDGTVDETVAVPGFINVNDGSNEGLRYLGKKIETVQFHPEACPGPQDSGFLFDRFIEQMKGE